MIVELSGRFVTAPAPYEYDFEPEDGGERKQGTSRKAYVHQVDGQKPALVQFDDEHAELYDQLRERAQFGEPVSMMVDTKRGQNAKFVGALRVGAVQAA